MLGVAITGTDAPGGWAPPPVTVPPISGLARAVRVNSLENLAITLLLAAMLTVHGLTVPTQAPLPDHPVKI